MLLKLAKKVTFYLLILFFYFFTGGSLSSSLCDIYYNELDIRYLGDIISQEDMFIRVADDYLFVSPCKSRAKKYQFFTHFYLNLNFVCISLLV